mmetsp:Transcript_86715/g.245894  ORF Transcript_86715/g.245894 Transcript_86715/m.245894 type:complete len:216 (+) Transcript_86715:1901-2548(+)
MRLSNSQPGTRTPSRNKAVMSPARSLLSVWFRSMYASSKPARSASFARCTSMSCRPNRFTRSISSSTWRMASVIFPSAGEMLTCRPSTAGQNTDVCTEAWKTMLSLRMVTLNSRLLSAFRKILSTTSCSKSATLRIGGRRGRMFSMSATLIASSGSSLSTKRGSVCGGTGQSVRGGAVGSRPSSSTDRSNRPRMVLAACSASKSPTAMSAICPGW